MTKCAIYTISFIQSNRLYIGSTLNHYRRKSQHLYLLRRNIHTNSKLQNYYNKYGESYMRFIVIESCLEEGIEYVRKREQYYLDQYFAQEFIKSNFKDKRFDKLTLNVTPEVDLMRVHWTKERREKLKKRNKNFNWTPEVRARMSKSKMGQKLSPEKEKTRLKASKAFHTVKYEREGRCCEYCNSIDVKSVGTRINKTRNVMRRRLKCNNCKRSYSIDLK